MNQALIVRDPEIMSAALCLTGTRVHVKNLFDTYISHAMIATAVQSNEDYLTRPLRRD